MKEIRALVIGMLSAVLLVSGGCAAELEEIPLYGMVTGKPTEVFHRYALADGGLNVSITARASLNAETLESVVIDYEKHGSTSIPINLSCVLAPALGSLKIISSAAPLKYVAVENRYIDVSIEFSRYWKRGDGTGDVFVSPRIVFGLSGTELGGITVWNGLGEFTEVDDLNGGCPVGAIEWALQPIQGSSSSSQ